MQHEADAIAAGRFGRGRGGVLTPALRMLRAGVVLLLIVPLLGGCWEATNSIPEQVRITPFSEGYYKSAGGKVVYKISIDPTARNVYKSIEITDYSGAPAKNATDTQLVIGRLTGNLYLAQWGGILFLLESAGNGFRTYDSDLFGQRVRQYVEDRLGGPRSYHDLKKPDCGMFQQCSFRYFETSDPEFNFHVIREAVIAMGDAVRSIPVGDMLVKVDQ